MENVNIAFLLKFFRLARGTANELDDRIRARGNAASMIEVPLERNVTQKDVYVENEELKVIWYSYCTIHCESSDLTSIIY